MENSLTIIGTEEFSGVFKQGGFDVIIGNPPYIKEFVNKDALTDCMIIHIIKEKWIYGQCLPVYQ